MVSEGYESAIEKACDEHLRQAMAQKFMIDLKHGAFGEAFAMRLEYGAAALEVVREVRNGVDGTTAYYVDCTIDVLERIDAGNTDLGFWLRYYWQGVVHELEHMRRKR